MKSIYALFLILFSFFGCKKYDEGGFHLFAKNKFNNQSGRFSKNTYWSLEKYEVNGIDSTDIVIPSNDPDLRNKYVFFHSESREYYACVQSGCNYQLMLSDDRKTLSIISILGGMYDQLQNGLIFRSVLTPNGKFCKWEIIKLKRSEMILKSEEGNIIYKLILKRY
jgi:hypothetical protein